MSNCVLFECVIEVLVGCANVCSTNISHPYESGVFKKITFKRENRLIMCYADFLTL
jgi:hypothetical protein